MTLSPFQALWGQFLRLRDGLPPGGRLWRDWGEDKKGVGRLERVSIVVLTIERVALLEDSKFHGARH